MKVDKVIVKTALIAVVGLGAMVSSASAAQKIHADYENMNAQQAKRAASTLRHHVEHPEVLIPELANTDTLEVLGAMRAGNFDQFARDYTQAAGEALEHYITTNLLPVDAPMLLATSANLANAATDHAVYALQNADGANIAGDHYANTGAWHLAHGGPGAANGNYVKDEMPADLTRDAFIAALQERMRNVTTARLHHLNAFALPATLTSEKIRATKIAVRDAVKAAVTEWLTLIDTTGGNMFNAAVPNAAGGGLAAAHITAGGAGAPGISVAVAPRNAPHPATLSAADVGTAFGRVIDMIDLF